VPVACSTRTTLSRTAAFAVTPRIPAAPLRISLAAHPDPAEWDAFVSAHPEGTIHHSIGWIEAVERTFGHKPLLLSAHRGGELVGVLPLMLVRSAIGGRMLVSVPYAIYGGVLALDARAAQSLCRYARELATKLEACVLDLRSKAAADPDLPIIDRYLTFRRPLPAHADDVPLWLPRKARAAARRAAEKYSLRVIFDHATTDDVWRLYSRSMRRLGSPNYPLRFFHELLRALPGECVVQVVKLGDRPVAGLMSFHARDVAMPYFVGHDERLEIYGINQFLYEHAMRHAVQSGCRNYDFGRSRADNSGSADFKRFCGFEPTSLQYQRFVPPGRRAPDLVPSSPRWSAARTIWRRLPLPITRSLGGRLAGSIPG